MHKMGAQKSSFLQLFRKSDEKQNFCFTSEIISQNQIYKPSFLSNYIKMKQTLNNDHF